MSTAKERAAARRKQLQQQHDFVIPLDGYEDCYAVRYRPLTYEEIWDLQQETGGTGQSAEGDLWYFGEMLARACLEFLEVQGKDEFQSTGQKWTPQMARELFDAELSDDATDHDAVTAVFGGPDGGSLLALHAKAFGEKSDEVLLGVNEAIRGNSEARSAAEEPSISQ